MTETLTPKEMEFLTDMVIRDACGYESSVTSADDAKRSAIASKFYTIEHQLWKLGLIELDNNGTVFAPVLYWVITDKALDLFKQEPARQTKTREIIQWIADHYFEDLPLSGWVTWRIAGEMQCARSTVYRAIKKLREMDAINGDGQYVGRKAVQPEEIAAFATNETLLLTDKKMEEIARALLTTRFVISAAVRWGVMCEKFIERNGGSYGYLLQVKG